jgi:Tfp pilus assembly protein PilX
MNMTRPFQDERGVALPMAMMTLLLLTTLMMAFGVLAQTEPVIAANQLRVAQARALADSGVERAIWSLTNSGEPGGLADPLPLTTPGDNTSAAVAPFNGATFISGDSLTSGGFTVAVRNDQGAPADPNVREITAVGWTPTNDAADGKTKAHRTVFVKVQVIPALAKEAPCALCVRGSLQAKGNGTVNGNNNDPACGGNNKYGAYSKDTVTISGNPTITGGAGGYVENQPAAAFEEFMYKDAALDTLKVLAKKNGTYFGPGFPNGGFVSDGSTTWSGYLSISSSNQVGNGIIFVDTVDGVNLDPAASNTDTLASLTIHGNPFTGLPVPGSTLPNVPVSSSPADSFSGVIVSNGSIGISGNMAIHGLVYAVNDFSYNGTGSGGIWGQAISQNVRDAASTSVDTSTSGNSQVIFNCQYAKGFDMIPPGFTVVPGSYRERADN